MSSTESGSFSSKRSTAWVVLAIAIGLVVIGGIIAQIAQTAGGTVSVRQVKLSGSNGVMIYGLLYKPVAATAKSPAPGVVAIHGYINSHDTMDGFSIELARRGCVVLAIDQTGHGFSDPPAFANGYGGPDALAYLHSLDFVKGDDIGLVGHSMGGWASVVAAAAHPDFYRSMVLVSSSTSTPPYEPIPGTPTFPKDVMVLEARFSEFSQLRWSVPKGSEFPTSARLQQLFGAGGPIVPGKVYGSIPDGTARLFESVPTTHPFLTLDEKAVGLAVDWMQQTLPGVAPLPSSSQIWPWDEVGTLIALIGVILLLFPVGTLFLRTPFFADLAQPVLDARPVQGAGLWIGSVILVAVGVLTFFKFQTVANALLPASALFAQSITTGIMGWAVGGGIIGLILFLLWHFLINRRAGGSFTAYGLTGADGRLEWARIGKSVLFAAAVLVAPYLALWFLQWAFATDARFWVFNAKIVTPVHLRIWLPYVIPFLFYFIVLGLVLHGELRSIRLSPGTEIVRSMVMLAGGFVLLILAEYIPLFAGGTLLTANQPLLAIVAYQFVPMYIIITSISTFFFYKTGRVIPGALINAFFITMLIVTSTATQFPLR